MPAVLLQDVLPGGPVEQPVVVAPDGVREVELEVPLGHVDLLLGDHRPHHVPLQEVLQAEEADLLVGPAAALEVGVDLLRAGGVLQVVRDLVGVREQQDVVEAVEGQAQAAGHAPGRLLADFGSLPDRRQQVVDQEAAVPEDLHELVQGGVALALGDRGPGAVLQLERQPTLLGLLARVRDGVLDDIDTFPVDQGVGALEGALVGVAVQLLQQRAAAAEGQVVRGVALVLHRLED
mmetsp:Transcript_10790/g.33523  ORF Transcript_10790/g.33523 Transcript_10790/m.33523 type:complete len:235 (+) Transcript_10790:1759-2463(+)